MSTPTPPEAVATPPVRRFGWRRALEWSFYAALMIFLFLYLRSVDYSTLRGLQPVWWALVVASVLALSFRYWGAFIWTTLLRSLGAHDVRLNPELVDVYAKSWLGRYIPGTAPWILGKIYFASQHGVPRSKLAVSSLLEAALQIIVQLLFALTLLAFDPRLDVLPASLRATFVVAIVACVAALVPAIFNRLLSTAFRLLRRGALADEHLVTWPTLLKGFGLYAIGAVVGGLSLYFIARTVDSSLEWAQLPFVVGVSTLAGAVSMLAVFVPGGIGVREGIQVALLSLIMPTEVAVLVAVTTRLHAVLIDLIFFGLARATRSVSRRRAAA
ncbi:flippase-like domain-containing protein [Actinotalea sp. M2MS4P-6]|uniref:flippase-like domain-containing protein n=1 Tax=Actinotalea sp. M2MS4P-6 TaxID=2983762 RepID=UPI0021E4606E|nr:flippase-like domain-containing protein [Actinotalea sp. M2MS4P-6]MCV2394174.1 flippase-like domain-containing protein [Actinotalea sp. M2MS4P-6]